MCLPLPVVQRAGECPLRAMLAQHFILLGRQRVAPLVIGSLDGELCVGCHLILSAAGAAQAAERGTEPERGPSHEQQSSAIPHVSKDARVAPECR